MDFQPMLSEVRLEALLPFFPIPCRPSSDGMKTKGGIIFVNKLGLTWRAAALEYSPHKTLHTRWVRWGKAGIIHRDQSVLSEMKAETHALMMDSTFSKASRHACNLGLEHVDLEPGNNRTIGGLYETTPAPEYPLERRRVGRTKGGVNTKAHCLADTVGLLMRLYLMAGQKSDCEGARVLLGDLFPALVLVADHTCDTNKIRDYLKRRKIRRCIPPRSTRKRATRYDRKICKSRHKIENSLGRMKDWNRVAFRCDRRPAIFLSACVLAAICIFWL